MSIRRITPRTAPATHSRAFVSVDREIFNDYLERLVICSTLNVRTDPRNGLGDNPTRSCSPFWWGPSSELQGTRGNMVSVLAGEKPTIKAIQTRWRGRHYRSRLEARWAVFFTVLDLTFQYEPESFVLADGSCYLPDFYLPQVKWYAEVKPHAGECGKAYPFVASSGFSALRLDGEPEYRSYTGFQASDGGPAHNEFSLDIWAFRRHFEDGWLFSEPDYSGVFLNVTEPEDAFSLRYRAAVTSALSERFGS